MKKWALPLLILIVCFLFFVSCTKERSVENGTVPVGNTNTNDACKSCSYLPWCDGSVYKYVDTTAAGVSVINKDLLVITDTLIGNITFTKTKSGNEFIYHHCNADSTTLIVFQNNNLSGSTQSTIRQPVLKSSLNAGSNWNTSVNINGSLVNYQYKIIAKSVNRTVLGRNFTDVIQVRQTISTQVPLIGNVVSSESDNFYAKNIGLIETITKDATTGNQILHRVLQQYQIP